MKRETVRIWIGMVLLFMLLIGLNAQDLAPYLQSPADTSIWITWKTETNPESKVLYGEDSMALVNTVTGDYQVLSDDGYDSNYFYHSVQLGGLEPDQFYYYRVVTGAQQSPIFRFRTQPSVGTSSGIYRFLVFGDHQVKNDDRYERLLRAARDKVIEKYGSTVEENVNLVINVGDQVDVGTLDHYEFVHFKPSAVLSGNIPIMTTVGNHETYGSLGLSAYYSHFFYDQLGYKGIVSPGNENYCSTPAYSGGTVCRRYLYIHSEPYHSGTHRNAEIFPFYRWPPSSVCPGAGTRLSHVSYYFRRRFLGPVLGTVRRERF
jgi:hypothetical protein